jgi:hypothetical protein
VVWWVAEVVANGSSLGSSRDNSTEALLTDKRPKWQQRRRCPSTALTFSSAAVADLTARARTVRPPRPLVGRRKSLGLPSRVEFSAEISPERRSIAPENRGAVARDGALVVVLYAGGRKILELGNQRCCWAWLLVKAVVAS